MATLNDLLEKEIPVNAENALLYDPSNPQPVIETEQVLTIEEEYPQFFDYTKATHSITALIADWAPEIEDAKMRRKERYADISIPQMRQAGKLLPDETFSINRVIDGNIVKEKSDAMAYLNSGFRLGIFSCLSKPEIDTLRLDIEVTQGLTYPGWYQEYERYIDGAMLHKYDAMEIVYDSTKPMKVGHEHVGFDNIFFDKGVDDINKSAFVLRRLRTNVSTLRKFISRGFSEAVINDMISKHEEKDPNHEFEIYKVWFIVNNCCYIAWWTNDSAVKEWLQAPKKLFLGIIDPATGDGAEIDSYPIVLYIYREDEQQKLVDKKGRAFLDGPDQESTTAIKTGYVNGLVRASNVYGSPKQDDDSSGEMKQLDVKLKHGCFYSKPVEFWRTEYPDISTLGALQYFDTANSSQLGKTAYSVVNRKDSRKTAEELKTAGAEEQKQTGTKLATFSECLRKILVFSWKIIQSQALQGKITLLLVKIEQPIIEGDPSAGTIPVYQNDLETLSQTFDIRPAGDTDVIAAAELIQRMQEDWPIVSQFPGLSQVFFQDYLKVRYPKKSQEYINALITGDPFRMALQQLTTLVKGFIQEGAMRAISPEEQQSVIQMVSSADALLTTQQTQVANI